jgi:X-Pro dipeptidyl-peptidase C-terminal non-catalytic domain
MRAQGTPVKMLWRSSGHSGGGISGESNSTNLESAYESRMALEWFDYYLRGIGDPPPLDFSFLRDWVKYTGDAAPAVGTTPTYPAGTDEPFFLSGTDELTANKSGVKAGTASFAASRGASPSGGQALTEVPGEDVPGTFASYDSPPLTQDLEVVGVPRLTIKLDAPTFAASQGTDPAGKLVLFVRMLDVDAEGATVLPRNQLSAVRVADVTKPVEIELPGIAYRFAKGHSLRLIVGTSNATNHGNNLAGPVSIVSDPATPNTLTIPKLGAQTGATGAGPSGTTVFQPAQGAPAPQSPGKGAKKRSLTAASLSGNRRCVKRRAVSLRIVRHKGENQAASAVMTVNGKRVRSATGRRLLSKFRLERMPKKGAYRVVVTVKTKGGRTLRSARTYRAC